MGEQRGGELGRGQIAMVDGEDGHGGYLLVGANVRHYVISITNNCTVTLFPVPPMAKEKSSVGAG